MGLRLDARDGCCLRGIGGGCAVGRRRVTYRGLLIHRGPTGGQQHVREGDDQENRQDHRDREHDPRHVRQSRARHREHWQPHPRPADGRHGEPCKPGRAPATWELDALRRRPGGRIPIQRPPAAFAPDVDTGVGIAAGRAGDRRADRFDSRAELQHQGLLSPAAASIS